MNLRVLAGTVTVALALAVGAAPAAFAQTSKPLSKKDVNKALKKSEKAVEQIQKASERNDAATAAAQAGVFTENFERVSTALANGQVRENDILVAAQSVDEATLKHIPVLQGLLDNNIVPMQARWAIEHAMAVSLQGHVAATQAILNQGQFDLVGGVLTDRGAQGAMARNEALLRHAERARRFGDEAAFERSIEQFTGNIDAVSRAIQIGAVHEHDAVSVFDRVSYNTLRHMSILEGLLGTVPEAAWPGIQKAIQMADKGHLAATQALANTPAAGVLTGRPGIGGAPSGLPGPAGAGGVGGRPAGAGPPGGRPGPPR